MIMPVACIIHLNLKNLNNFDFSKQGQEGRYSIYVHASREKPVHTSSLFVGRDIHSDAVITFIFRNSVFNAFPLIMFFIKDLTCKICLFSKLMSISLHSK